MSLTGGDVIGHLDIQLFPRCGAGCSTPIRRPQPPRRAHVRFSSRAHRSFGKGRSRSTSARRPTSRITFDQGHQVLWHRHPVHVRHRHRATPGRVSGRSELGVIDGPRPALRLDSPRLRDVGWLRAVRRRRRRPARWLAAALRCRRVRDVAGRAGPCGARSGPRSTLATPASPTPSATPPTTSRHFAGTGTAVYSPTSCSSRPPSRPRAVETSGKAVRFYVQRGRATAAVATPLQARRPHDLGERRSPRSPLVNPWVPASTPSCSTRCRRGPVVASGDAVVDHGTGSVGEYLRGHRGRRWPASRLDQRRRSTSATDTLAKTLRLAGTMPTSGARTPGSTRSPRTGGIAATASFRHVLRRQSQAAIKHDQHHDQQRLLQDAAADAGGQDVGGPPGPVGGRVGRDENPGNPTTLGLDSPSNLLMKITERLNLANPGVGGIGKVRVFLVEQLSTVPQAGT